MLIPRKKLYPCALVAEATTKKRIAEKIIDINFSYFKIKKRR